MKLLINWDYNRKDLLEGLQELIKANEVVFIYKFDRDPDDADFPFQVVYWNDFNSPYQVLNEIKPDKIIFHDIEAFYQVSLNIAAKNKNITTFILEHGLRGSYEVDIAVNNYKNRHKVQSLDKSTDYYGKPLPKKNNLLSFYLKCLRWNNFWLIFALFRFAYYRRKFGLTLGLYYCQGKFRQPTYYLNYTLHNAGYIMKRDRVPANRVRCFGNPAFDKFFNIPVSENNAHKKYFLLIDSPLAEIGNFDLTIEEKNNFLIRLNEYCMQEGAVLKVKLHPFSFHTPYFQHENIMYLREADILSEINGAAGCFMIHFSSLSPVAMYYKPCILFNAINEYNTDITSHNLIPTCNIRHFSLAEIKFREVTDELRDFVVKHYLYSIDGMSQTRLKNLVHQL